ncbi:FAD-dependent monooxygenase [Spirosoma validum]|uniref:FAD-dependent monooxygenase n=1 Tax=Spirosoma validum TaxID=2771355 RepID=A0A927B1Z1_9BACT|nr:FAD-dependent monooxygenase [Spirosoma validum]MBD2753928.1 FAD-dependent monooxygenase [Spirosoma validum]
MAIPDSKKVLIAGASIAGPTLAFWLAKYGFTVTVVERSKTLRLGGQNIDVNGPAKQIAQKMRIEAAIRAANTGEVGLQLIGQNEQAIASFPKEGSISGTQELEILRGDLVNILYEATKQNVEYRFGDSITNLEQHPNEVTVTFSSGKKETFQLVVAADGVRSSTRRLVFGDEPKFEYLGLYTAYLTIPRIKTDTNWWRWYTATDRRIVMLRPDNQGTMRASVAFLESDEAYEKLSLAEQKSVLKSKLVGAGWEADRISNALDDSVDVYFDKIGQIKAPSWSSGRMAMIGDAAYCPTPLTGKGTTLAMVGAYLLAGELSQHERHQDAFVAYEQRMRPYVEEVQKLPPGVPWLVYPRTRFGVSVLNTVAGIIASKPVQKLFSLFTSTKTEDESKAEGIVLPDYVYTHAAESS